MAGRLITAIAAMQVSRRRSGRTRTSPAARAAGRAGRPDGRLPSHPRGAGRSCSRVGFGSQRERRCPHRMTKSAICSGSPRRRLDRPSSGRGHRTCERSTDCWTATAGPAPSRPPRLNRAALWRPRPGGSESRVVTRSGDDRLGEAEWTSRPWSAAGGSRRGLRGAPLRELPLGPALPQALGSAPGGVEGSDGLVGVRAERPAAVGDDLAVGG